MPNLKPGIQAIEKNGLYYITDRAGRVRRFKPWLGDSLSFLYDLIMSRSVFPRKFGADMAAHYAILTQALADVHSRRVLELATGSGSAVHFLDSDNRYTGTDISPGLLRRAARRFREAGFSAREYYVVSADDLPFKDQTFDLVLCILSLNFFDAVAPVLDQAARVLTPGGRLLCSVPIPERNRRQSTIRGRLYSEAEWGTLCREHGFQFDPLPAENGALLYFQAHKPG